MPVIGLTGVGLVCYSTPGCASTSERDGVSVFVCVLRRNAQANAEAPMSK